MVQALWCLYLFVIFFQIGHSEYINDNDDGGIYDFVEEDIDYSIYKEPRVRKAWHLTSTDEKALFIEAVHKLNKNKKLTHYSKTHHSIVDSTQAHMTSAFFAWHRYLLWDFENQVRKLGEKFKAFAVPYWDVTHDSGTFHEANIINSGLGGGGVDPETCCVDGADDAWSRDNYPTYNNYRDYEVEQGLDSCLKRWSAHDTSVDLWSSARYAHFILSKKVFGANHGFRYATFQSAHGLAHCFIGGSKSYDTHMTARYAPDDPSFWMLHSWFDYSYVVWQGCHGYNKIMSSELDAFPEAFTEYPTTGDLRSGLDDDLVYSSMVGLEWFTTIYNEIEPTARKLYHGQRWNTMYEEGTFITNAHLSESCKYREWDRREILENSEATLAIIAATERTEVEVYQQNAWEALQAIKVSGDSGLVEASDGGTYEDMDYSQSWSAKVCNYQRQRVGQDACSVSEEYGTCDADDDEDTIESEYTKEDLLGMDGIVGCVREVRESMFGYAKGFRVLKELCMGRFDEDLICEMPKIEVMIDEDDSGYYANMKAINVNNDNEEFVMGNVNIVNDNMSDMLNVSSSWGMVIVVFAVVMFAFIMSMFIVQYRSISKSDVKTMQFKRDSAYGSV